MSEITKSSILGFGKYKGKTGEEVARTNPSYLMWVSSNLNRVTVSEDLKKMAIACGMLESEWAAEDYGTAADYGFEPF